jgi:hypothetical protein
MKTATMKTLRAAWNKACRSIEHGATATEHDAGFIIPEGQKKGDVYGWQVFVKMQRYSDAALKKNLLSGGLY